MTEIVLAQPLALDRPARYSAAKHPALVYLAGLSESSRRPQAQSLNMIAEIVGVDRMDNDSGGDVRYMAVPWGALRYEHTNAIRARLAETCAAATANRHLSALRGVLKDAWRLGYMSAEDYMRAVDLKAVKGQKVKPAETGRHLQSGEIAALMEACYDQTKAGVRDAAILAVGYGCGLRRSEIASFALADFDPEAGSLRIRKGKGNKERVTYLPEGAAAALCDWITVRGDAAGPLFYSIRRGDHLESKGLTDQAIYNILASRAQAAGVKKFSPHDLRRTFAGEGFDAGIDPATLQQMMGHANINTTAGYDRRPGQAKKKAAGKIHVPYRSQILR